MENEEKICIDCGHTFTITPGFYKLQKERGVNPTTGKPNFDLPKRCYDCRQKRKAEKENKEPRSFGGDNFDSRW